MNISIILTTYNAARYISESLNSIIEQTYKNYEVVVVDDGSGDNTVSLLRAYALSHSFVKFNIIEMTHIGRSEALNLALSQARYEWVAIIDADDLWHAQKLEHQVKCIENDQSIVFLVANASLFFEDEKINIHANLSPGNKETSRLSLDQMLYANRISHSSILARKDLLHYGKKEPSDYALWLILLSRGCEIHRIDEPLAHHRIHDEQNFEAKNRLSYVLNTTLLQLKYCCLNYNLGCGIFLILKLLYYFVPRKIRLRTLRKGLYRLLSALE